MHRLQHARDLALDDSPDQGRIRSLVIVDQDVPEVVHLTPGEFRVRCTELRPDFPRSFSKIEEKMSRNGGARAKTCTFLQPIAALPDVKEVGPGISGAHDLKRPCLGQDWLPHVPKAVGRDYVDINSE